MSKSSKDHQDRESPTPEKTTKANTNTPSTTDIDVNPFKLIVVLVIAFIFSMIVGYLCWIVEYLVSDHFLDDPGFVLIQTIVSLLICFPMSLIAQFTHSIRMVTKWGIYIGGAGGLITMMMYFPRAHLWLGNNLVLLLSVSFILNILIGLLSGLFFYLIIWGRTMVGKKMS